jgi:hypothetical protein
MKIRAFASLASFAITTTLLAAQAHAGVINFDDLDAKGKLSSINPYNPYQGLTFDKNWYLGDTSVAGYGNAAHSGTNYVNNGFGVKSVSVSSSTGFDFAGAWFAAPAINGTQAGSVNLSAYDAGGALIGSTGDMAITNSFVFINANFMDVSKLVITRDKGFFVMDDFTVADAPSSQVPEPAGVFALGLGLVGLARRRRAKLVRA